MIRLRHLERCMSIYPAGTGLGRCFHWSTALCLDLKGSDIVIGSLAGVSSLEEALASPNGTPGRFIHAWVERGDDVFAPTMIGKSDERLAPIYRPIYYATNDVQDVRQLSRDGLLVAFRGYNLISHLTEGVRFRNDVRFADHLLSSAGVEWTLDEQGGVVPKVAA